MIWRIFTHKCRFKHNVTDAAWLEDKGCLTPHEHGFDPNPLCEIEFRVATAKVIDFKTIKRFAIPIIEDMANEIIQEEKEDQVGHLLQPAYYDFGTLLTENMVDDLKKLMFMKLSDEGYLPERVQVMLHETRKYSIWDDGVMNASELEDD
jgi:hypothetical protein